MNWKSLLEYAINNQDLSIDVKYVPLDITLKNGRILSNCFIEFEDNVDKLLFIVETNRYGGEEIRLIPENEISCIDVVYALPEICKEDVSDNMFV